MFGIALKQNAFKFKIPPHNQKSIVKFYLAGRWAPLANEALCLNTPKYNGKSGTAYHCITLTNKNVEILARHWLRALYSVL